MPDSASQRGSCSGVGLRVGTQSVTPASRGEIWRESFGRLVSINLATSETGGMDRGDYSSAFAMRPPGIRPRPLDAGNLNRGLRVVGVVGWVGKMSVRMHVRKCVRMHRSLHVNLDM